MEWIGSFEVPDSGHRVGGRLVIDDRTSSLTTFGPLIPRTEDFSLPDDNVRLPMVRGVSEDGKRVTAVELASVGGSLFSGPAGTWSAETWLCGYAVEAHFDLEDPVIFTAGSVGLTYLSSWLQSPRPKTKFTSDSYRLKIEMKSLAVTMPE